MIRGSGLDVGGIGGIGDSYGNGNQRREIEVEDMTLEK